MLPLQNYQLYSISYLVAYNAFMHMSFIENMWVVNLFNINVIYVLNFPLFQVLCDVFF